MTSKPIDPWCGEEANQHEKAVKQHGAWLRITSPEGVISIAPLNATPFTVGRAVTNHTPDLALSPDPHRWVGRLQCTLDVDTTGKWFLTDTAEKNATRLRRRGEKDPAEIRCTRVRVHHQDTICIRGAIDDAGREMYWELVLHDQDTTRGGNKNYSLQYDDVENRLFRCNEGVRTEIEILPPRGRNLIVYMAEKSRKNGGGPVACETEDLLAALYGPKWQEHNFKYNHIAAIVRTLRDLIEPDRANPCLLETVPGGGGYRINFVSG